MSSVLLLTARPWAERGSCSAAGFFFFFFNRAAMGRTRFLLYRYFIYLFFLFLSVTRPKLPLGQIVSVTSNHATDDVYSP